jgi:hypothetical protein
MYRQRNRLILHLVNLTHARAWPGYVEEHVGVGPLEVSIFRRGALPQIRRAILRVASVELPVEPENERLCFRIPEVHLHELVVLE